jgi:hypothetical protein
VTLDPCHRNGERWNHGTVAANAASLPLMIGRAMICSRLAVYRGCDRGIDRWLSEDPLGLVDGRSLYAYGRNASTRFTDPHGLQVIFGQMAPWFDPLTAEWRAGGDANAFPATIPPARDGNGNPIGTCPVTQPPPECTPDGVCKA